MNYVVPETPKKLYSLYFPTEEFFTRCPAGPDDPVIFRREHRTPPILLPEHSFAKLGALDDPGHRGVYHFDQKHLDFIYEHGDVWNGTQFPYYASFLVMDLDTDGDRSIEVLKRGFSEYDYLIYATGGGSDKYHFVVPHNLISHVDIAACYSALIAYARIRVDGSILMPLGAVSLPGTKHPVTGVRKTLVSAHSGRRLFFKSVNVEAMLELGKNLFGEG